MIANDPYNQAHNVFFNSQQLVTIQLKKINQNNHQLSDITTLIHCYTIVDSDCFVPLQEIRNVAYKKTERLSIR